MSHYQTVRVAAWRKAASPCRAQTAYWMLVPRHAVAVALFVLAAAVAALQALRWAFAVAAQLQLVDATTAAKYLIVVAPGPHLFAPIVEPPVVAVRAAYFAGKAAVVAAEVVAVGVDNDVVPTELPQLAAVHADHVGLQEEQHPEVEHCPTTVVHSMWDIEDDTADCCLANHLEY